MSHAGHCKKLGPDWGKLGDAMGGESKIHIATVDCTVEKSVCQTAEVGRHLSHFEKPLHSLTKTRVCQRHDTCDAWNERSSAGLASIDVTSNPRAWQEIMHGVPLNVSAYFIMCMSGFETARFYCCPVTELRGVRLGV